MVFRRRTHALSILHFCFRQQLLSDTLADSVSLRSHATQQEATGPAAAWGLDGGGGAAYSQVTVRSQSGHSQVYSQVTVRSCKLQAFRAQR